MKIIIDAMGGDNAPFEIVKGGLDAAAGLGCEIVLVGRGEEILGAIKALGHSDIPRGVEISHADGVIGMRDDPSAAAREMKDSSIVVAMNLLTSGGGDAFVSAGSTGALLSAATLIAKRIKGIRRAALAPVIPTKTGRALLIDCGATVDATPEYLLQFGYMGAYYAKSVLGMESPRVGLLNIGTEEAKGTALQREAFALLRDAGKSGKISFVGNVEGREALFGACDVIVADGFSGNIFLKTLEGSGLFFIDLLKGIFRKNPMTKLAALLCKNSLKEFKKLLDYNETGGAPLLGIARPVIKAHGSAKALTVSSAVKQAMLFVESGIISDIVRDIDLMKTGGHGAE